ncbi:MAG: hypothetical protein ACRDJ1_05665 [Actinomycetota bacterium]
MKPPPVSFATNPDGDKIGYQVLGDGSIDLAFVSSLNPNVDVLWEHPNFDERGAYTLKGVPGEWRLFAVV